MLLEAHHGAEPADWPLRGLSEREGRQVDALREADRLKTITVEVGLFSRSQFREWLRGQQSKNKYIDVRFTETEEPRKSLFKIVVSGNSVKAAGWCLAAKGMVKKLQEE